MQDLPSNVDPGNTRVLFPLGRDPRLPAIYVKKNHPLHVGATAYYFVHDGSPEASREVYRMEVEDLKIPQGSGEEAKALGFLELKPGDIIFSRLKSSPSSGLEDIPVMWVTGNDIIPQDLRKQALDARDASLGGRPLRSRDHARPDHRGVVSGGTAWERSFKGKYYDKERGRCYPFGCTYQKQKTVYSPCAAGKLSVADEATLKMRSDLCSVATEMAMLSLSQGPEHLVEAIKLNHNLFNTPRVGSRSNFAFTSNQLNLAHIREWNTSETLADSMGIKFGGAHIDRLDSPGHFTNMVSLSDLPDDCDPGRFFIVYPGVFCTLHNFVSVNFSGLRVHGGSPPIAAKNTLKDETTGEDPMEWGIRCMVVSYAKTAAVSSERKMPLMQIEHDKVLSVTPEMLRPGKFNVPRKFDATNFVKEGPTIMSPSAMMEFMGRCFLLIILALVTNLPPSMGVNVDSDTFLKSFSYLDTDGTRCSLGAWVDGPGWRQRASIGDADPLSDELIADPPSLVSQQELLVAQRKRWMEHVNTCAGHIPSAVSCLPDVTPLEGWSAGQPLVKINRISFNKGKKANKGKKVSVVEDEDNSSSDDDEDTEHVVSRQAYSTLRHAGSDARNSALAPAAPALVPSASRPKLLPVVLIERSASSWPYQSLSRMDNNGSSAACLTNSSSVREGAKELGASSRRLDGSEPDNQMGDSSQSYSPLVDMVASSPSTSSSDSNDDERSPPDYLDRDDRTLKEEFIRAGAKTRNGRGDDTYGLFGSSDHIDDYEVEEDAEDTLAVNSGEPSSRPQHATIPGKRRREDTPDSGCESVDKSSDNRLTITRQSKRQYTGFDNIWTSDGYAKLEIHLTECGLLPAGPSTVGSVSGDEMLSSSVHPNTASSLDTQEEAARLRELPKSLHGITSVSIHNEVQQLQDDIVELAAFSNVFDVMQTVDTLLDFQKAVNSNPMEIHSVFCVQAAWSGIEILGRYEKINSLRLRKLRACIMLSSAASWKWLTITVPEAINLVIREGANRSHWLASLLDAIRKAVQNHSANHTFSPLDFGLALNPVRCAVVDLAVYDVPGSLDRDAWLSLYISVTRKILETWLSFPSGRAIWRGLFALNIVQWIGPEFLLLNLIWYRFQGADEQLLRFSALPSNLDITRYPLLCPTSALRRDVARLAQLVDDYISGRLYRYVKFEAQSGTYIDYVSEGLRQISEERMLYFKRFMLRCFKHLLRGETANNSKLETLLDTNPDKYSPFRELAPTRINMLRGNGPFSDIYLRTLVGLFGALVNRGVTFGTTFSRSGRTVFASPADFFLAVEQCADVAVGEPKTYCDPGAYGRPNPKRQPDLVYTYWNKLQEVEWDGLTSKTPVAFADAYKFFFPPAGARPFPELGPLGAYLITVDYAYARVVALPNFADMGRTIYTLDKGPARALQYLGLVSVESDKPKTSAARERRVTEFVKAFAIADKLVKDSIPQEYHLEVGLNIFVVEHSLCKFMRAHKLCDLSL